MSSGKFIVFGDNSDPYSRVIHPEDILKEVDNEPLPVNFLCAVSMSETLHLLKRRPIELKFSRSDHYVRNSIRSSLRKSLKKSLRTNMRLGGHAPNYIVPVPVTTPPPTGGRTPNSIVPMRTPPPTGLGQLLEKPPEVQDETPMTLGKCLCIFCWVCVNLI